MRLLKALLIAFIVVVPTYSIDNHHFYRASNFFYVFDEPRLERPFLTSFDVTVGHGATKKSRTNHESCSSLCVPQCTCSCSVPKDGCNLLQICGLHNIHALGKNVPGKDLSDPVDLALTNLSLLSGGGCFGKLRFTGTFTITEANFFFTQNFKKGLFFQAHIPLRKVSITDICRCDLTPTNGHCFNKNTPEWKTVLNLFDEITTKYCLNICDFDETGVGDTTALIGWTNSYQETEELDFIDTTIRVGVLIPTGHEKNVNNVFEIPLGYDGHIGIPLSFDFSLGAFEWATIGFHIGALVFVDHTKKIRLKSDVSQCGLITLTSGRATVERGTLWDAVVYAKADHFARGLSLLFGYTFARQNPSSIRNICDDCLPDPCITTNDCLWRGWKMHTLHFMAEYDFTRHNGTIGPHIGFFYNRQVGGVRVFKTSMVGGNVGIDIGCRF